jgi:hypothetical protein
MVASSIPSAAALSPRESAATKAAPIVAGSPLLGAPEGGTGLEAGDGEEAGLPVGVGVLEPQAASTSGTRTMSVQRRIMSRSSLRPSSGRPGWQRRCGRNISSPFHAAQDGQRHCRSDDAGTADNPERLITPGVFNPAVTQATIKTTICVP